MKRLIIRPGAIGDLIVSLPALEYLRTDYTEVWVTERNVPLVRFAHRVRSIGSTGIDMLEFGESCPPLETFDDIVSWYGAARESFQDAVRHLPFRFFPALPTTASIHAADFYLAQVGAPLGAAPRIECTPARTAATVIHPFSGSPKKNWPLERFAELARNLPEVEWCAGPGEALNGARRFDDLYQLACWLAGASLYIGNDSGVTHLAAACGVPVVALFGPTDPAVWAPRGPRVSVLRHQPIDQLPVEAVLKCIQ